MKEKEFDIQVRNLLSDATDTVSPGVWSGVQAALARRARIVAIRRWSFSAVAAAAAIAAVMVLIRPDAPSAKNSPLLSDMVLSAAQPEIIVQMPVSKVYSIPQRVSAAPAQEAPVENVITPQEEPIPENKPESTGQEFVPRKKDGSAYRDNSPAEDIFASLESDRPKNNANKFSFTVSGNLQGSQRGGVSGTPGRAHGLPEAFLSKEGIYNESAEAGFRLPFSAGIGFNYNFTPRWGIGTGIRYTNLGRTFVGDYVSDQGFTLERRDIDNQQHWLGIPLNVYFNFVNNGRWNVHAFAGGALEFLVDNDYLIHNSPKDIHYHQRGTAPQWSAGLGVGIEFKITPFLGIYLDPAVRYYFGTDRQPRSLRTIQPLRFDIEAGLRFSVGK